VDYRAYITIITNTLKQTIITAIQNNNLVLIQQEQVQIRGSVELNYRTE
jgi:hypothetical protein